MVCPKRKKKDVFVINSDAQSSLQESENFRPKGVNNQMMPEENWDLYAAGKIVKWIIEQSKLHTGAKYSVGGMGNLDFKSNFSR